MKKDLTKQAGYAILKIIAIYAVFSGLWIYLSDTALGLLISDPAIITRISVFKGLLFVVVTSILLYYLSRRYLLESTQLKEALKNKDQLFNILSESMIDAYASIDMTGRILQFNEVYRTLLGYEAEELLTMTYLDLTPEKWHAMQRKIIEEQVIPTGHSGIFEKEYRRKDGTVFPVELRLQLVNDDEGNPYVMWAIVHDISERKRIQDNLAFKSQQLEEVNQSLEIRVEKTVLELRQRDEALLQQNRLAIMGDMINIIAHQWRQPLNTLGLYLQLLPSEFKHGGLNREYLDKYVNDSMLLIDHMSSTIDDFSCFFKPDKEKESFNVNHSVDRAIQLIKAAYDYNHIKIVVNCMDEPVIHGYSNEFSQVVLNILCNAKDALLTSKPDHPLVIITTKVEDGRSVVTISDNAGGIPGEILYKVFDPFFPTKGVHGTGIGLSMSKYIIERNMNGLLNVCNNEAGAEFRIVV